MKYLLKLEEVPQFLFCLALLSFLDQPWWVYVLLVIGPDTGMLGYLVGPRTGAVTYNLLHHKGLALLVILAGAFAGFDLLMSDAHPTSEPKLFITGVVLYGHACMDRIFGYGLKFGDSFHHTHLGWIGKRDQRMSGSEDQKIG